MTLSLGLTGLPATDSEYISDVLQDRIFSSAADGESDALRWSNYTKHWVRDLLYWVKCFCILLNLR